MSKKKGATKSKKTKKRANSYEPKLKVEGKFIDVINAVVKK